MPTRVEPAREETDADGEGFVDQHDCNKSDPGRNAAQPQNQLAHEVRALLGVRSDELHHRDSFADTPGYSSVPHQYESLAKSQFTTAPEIATRRVTSKGLRSENSHET